MAQSLSKSKNILVIYDSAFGNTAMAAKAIAEAIGRSNTTTLRLVKEASLADVQGTDVLIIGSPTQGARPTQAIQDFLDQLPEESLHGVKVAAFDTRFASNDRGWGLRLLMKTIGFAAPRIAKDLQTKGGILAIGPQGFIVDDKEGPLKRGELEHAKVWAERLRKQVA